MLLLAMVGFHYVLCCARHATILLDVLVLLSTGAANEQTEENECARRRKRERERQKGRKSFLYANTASKIGLVCIF
jgi:hypothetical protein